MLCSISTGKSGLNWLDRLRSSKGLPVGNGLDLEHFLNTSPNPDPNSDAISEKHHPKLNSDSVPLDADQKKTMANSKAQKNREKDDWFDIMSSALAELFNMGDSNGFQRIRMFDEKRSSRKQPNPKICMFSASTSVDDCYLNGVRRAEGVLTMSPSSADNSVTEVKETDGWLKPKKQGSIASAIVEEDKWQTDLSGDSRADVTIIDTSSPTWKSEKLVFRKGNVWKVRDKKSRKVSGCRKKRKASHSDSEGEGKKKKKRKPSPFPSSTSKEVGREARIILSNEGCPQNVTRRACKETPVNHTQVPRKRSPRKPAKRDSSVFHVQGIPSSRKNGAHIPKGCAKDT